MYIEKHKFYELDNSAEDCGDYVQITYPDFFESTGFCGSLVNIYKPDVIALAKHFKLTKEDLD